MKAVKDTACDDEHYLTFMGRVYFLESPFNLSGPCVLNIVRGSSNAPRSFAAYGLKACREKMYNSALDERFGLLHAPTTLPQERTQVVRNEEPLSIWSESKAYFLYASCLSTVCTSLELPVCQEFDVQATV